MSQSEYEAISQEIETTRDKLEGLIESRYRMNLRLAETVLEEVTQRIKQFFPDAGKVFVDADMFDSDKAWIVFELPESNTVQFDAQRYERMAEEWWYDCPHSARIGLFNR